jgi:transcription initiation factor IIE alpha subunit
VEEHHENLPQPVFSLCATPTCVLFASVYTLQKLSMTQQTTSSLLCHECGTDLLLSDTSLAAPSLALEFKQAAF